MNLTAIRTLIRNQSDTETDDISDDDIDSWVNHRYGLINSRLDWPYLEAGPTDIAVTDAATSFSVGSLTPAFSEFREVRYAPTGGTQNVLRQVNVEERPDPNANVAQGRPWCFWRVGSSTTVNLDRPVDAGTITVAYYRTAPELDDSDEPLFDARFHRLLVIGGLIEVYERTFDFDEAGREELKFERGMEQMDDFYNRLRQTTRLGEHGTFPPNVPNRLRWSWE